jgi:Bacteriocin-protection, YdeI or OmpD-Associated/Domain of unknown function (DUF1905)
VTKPKAKTSAPKRTYKATLVLTDDMNYVPVPFDPKEVFGKVRAPVNVTLNGHTFRSTIFSMRGCMGIPLRRSNREAAKLVGNETLEVTLELDTAPRVVEPPKDLVKALKAVPAAWTKWQALSYTHQREHVEAIEGAKQPETRVRRIANAVKMCAATR